MGVVSCYTRPLRACILPLCLSEALGVLKVALAPLLRSKATKMLAPLGVPWSSLYCEFNEKDPTSELLWFNLYIEVS